MALATNILRRGAVYYFRCGVPAALIAKMGCREIWISLRTKEPSAARLLAAKMLTAAHEMFEKVAIMKTSLTPSDIANLKAFYFDQVLEADAKARSTGTAITKEAWRAAAQDRQFEEARVRDHLARGEFSEITGWAETLLEIAEIAIAPNSPAFMTLCQALLQVKLEAVQHQIRRDRGDWTLKPRDPDLRSAPTAPSPPPAPTTPTPQPNRHRKAAPPLLELAKQFIAEKRRAAEKKEGEDYAYLDEMMTTFEWFQQFIGPNKLVTEITAADVREWRDMLLHLPKRWETRHKGLTIREAMALGKERPDIEKLSLSSLKIRNLGPVKNLLEWIADREIIDPLKLDRIIIEIPKSVRNKKKRDAFTTPQLQQIFAAKPYQAEAAAGLPINDPELWVPLVALYSGGRRGEICQLRVSDVETHDGVECFSINELPDPVEEPALYAVAQAEAAKGVKNPGSVRLIPVHPMLVQLGIRSYIEQRRESGELLLFPIRPGAKDRADAFGKWFNRLVTDAGAKTPRNCFHSFRHNFEKAMLAAIRDFQVRCALGGRTEEHSSNDYHEGDVPVAVLAEEIRKVSYPDLNLDHLLPRPTLAKAS